MTADLDATAAFALGAEGPGWLAQRPGRLGIVVHADRRLQVVGQ